VCVSVRARSCMHVLIPTSDSKHISNIGQYARLVDLKM